MHIFPFQSNRKGPLLCVQSELYIPRILKKNIKQNFTSLSPSLTPQAFLALTLIVLK